MNDRKQDNPVMEAQDTKNERVVAVSAVFTPPTQDEEAFLKRIERASEGYDPKVTVGGPRAFAT